MEKGDYNKGISADEHERLKSILSDEILKRDKIIDKLKAENNILMKTALKRSEDLNDLKRTVSKLLEGKKN